MISAVCILTCLLLLAADLHVVFELFPFFAHLSKQQYTERTEQSNDAADKTQITK